MIFVRLAGGRDSSAFDSTRTLPVSASTRMYPFADNSGAFGKIIFPWTEYEVTIRRTISPDILIIRWYVSRVLHIFYSSITSGMGISFMTAKASNLSA
jgi:hypothetical protein